MKEYKKYELLVKVLREIIDEYQSSFKNQIEVSDETLISFSKDYEKYMVFCNANQISIYSEIVKETFPYNEGTPEIYEKLIMCMNELAYFRIDIADVFLIMSIGLEEDLQFFSPATVQIAKGVRERFNRVK